MVFNWLMDDARLKSKTGKTGDEWIAHLEAVAEKPIDAIEHKDMAQIACDTGITEWWAQGVAVSIEQHIGRRVVGQTCRGTYAANASKTIPGEWLDTFEKFCTFMEDKSNALLSPPTSEPRITESEKWRYWKIDLADGSKVSVNCQAKPAKDPANPKVGFGVSHDNVGSMESREEYKAMWKELLAEFAASLPESKQ